MANLFSACCENFVTVSDAPDLIKIGKIEDMCRAYACCL